MDLKKLFFSPSTDENIVTIVDIGSSKIVCLVAKMIAGEFSIIGSSCQSAYGFKNGNIIDAKAARLSIITAVNRAEKDAGTVVEKVILALNGNKIHSHYITCSIALKTHKVTEHDVEALVEQGIQELEKTDNEVIHYFPLEYNIDGNADVKDPQGLLGKRISAKIHFVTVSSPLLDNIINCLANCQLDVVDCVFSPYASGLATLSTSEKEIGATVIDFGDGITSYALFLQNNMVNCGFIPIGSKAITNDIAKSFMLDSSNAERIKTIYGAASVNYSDNQKMINLDSEDRSISNAELNEVINARVEEILTLVKNILDKQYISYPNAKYNIILTGGGSMLMGISEQASKIFTSKVRIGKTLSIEGLSKESVDATYAAASGVVQYLANNKSSNEFTNPSSFKKILHWIKNNF
jgi:cell division protein FtsA